MVLESEVGERDPSHRGRPQTGGIDERLQYTGEIVLIGEAVADEQDAKFSILRLRLVCDPCGQEYHHHRDPHPAQLRD